MEMKKKATIVDVAKEAGVSVATVSRVVNLEPHIRPEVIRRVRAAIAELGWVPNGSARALRTGRTNVVAVAVPHLQRPYHALLAEALGVTRQTIISIEKERFDPSLPLAFQIASAFDLSIEDIFLPGG